MLPVLEPDGRSTAHQTVIYAVALVPVSLAPTLVGLTGPIYFAGALVLAAFHTPRGQVRGTRSLPDARRLFFGSIIYLPFLWIFMIFEQDVAAWERLRNLYSTTEGSSRGSRRPQSSRIKAIRMPREPRELRGHRDGFVYEELLITIADLPAVNATLNAISAILLTCGYIMIRRATDRAHRRFMMTAFTTSTLFLACYLVYHANIGSRPFPGRGRCGRSISRSSSPTSSSRSSSCPWRSSR